MHKYCLDTSGISNPLAQMPEDIFAGLWGKIAKLVENGFFCCTTEIADEYQHIEGNMGRRLSAHKASMVYEIGQDNWDWAAYVGHVNHIISTYRQFISEYNSNRKNTVGLSDVSIVALAKTLNLPVVSMEGLDGGQTSATKMRIPRLCKQEGVKHLTFNDLLRAEGLSI
jgi:hypothetical protein